MKAKHTLHTLLGIASASLLTYASAADYYWDSDNANPGFGAVDGTWADPTASTATGGFTTDPTGATAIDANGPVTTTTSDNVYFGTPTVPYAGKTTLSGTLSANYLFQGNANFLGTTPTLNFSAAGTFERGSNNHQFPTGTTLTGATTSMTWVSRRNLALERITSSTAGTNILSTSTTSPYVYPGKVAMNSGVQLGAANADLVFNHGILRMNDGFPYASLSTLDAAHPVTFTLNKDAGLENNNPSIDASEDDPFIVDQAIDLGTGAFWVSGSRVIKLTETTNNWSHLYIWMGANKPNYGVEVSNNAQLGPLTAPITFGSGSSSGSGGVLRIAGSSMSDLGSRTVNTTSGKPVGINILEASHTFTLDKLLDQGNGKFHKLGPGTLVLTEANTYTGLTEILDGTLLINGAQPAATGVVDVRTGSVLGGTGTIGGSVTVENTSGLTFDLSTAPGSHDKLDVAGSLTTESGSQTLTLTSTGGTPEAGTYTLVTAAGGVTLTGTFNVVLPAGWTANAPAVVGNDLQIEITSVGGGYDSWAGTNAGGQTADLDADDDGVDNGVEYFMDAPAGFTATPVLDASNVITWTNGGNIPSADYGTQFVIQTSSDLVTWTDVLIGELTANTDTTLSYTLTGGSKNFVRLKVTPN